MKNLITLFISVLFIVSCGNSKTENEKDSNKNENQISSEKKENIIDIKTIIGKTENEIEKILGKAENSEKVSPRILHVKRILVKKSFIKKINLKLYLLMVNQTGLQLIMFQILTSTQRI